MRRSVVGILLAVGGFLGPIVAADVQAQAIQRRPFSFDDLARLQSVTDPHVSPDGVWVAYTVNATDTKADKSTSDIWMTRWDGTAKLQLTSTSESEHHPQFSPDGRYLSFLSARDREPGITQLWLMNREGGEATCVTDFKGDVSDYDWSPDGKRLALVVHDENPETSAAKDGKDKDKAPPPIVIDRFQFKDDGVGYLRGLRQHVYVFDLEGRKSVCLTPGNHDEYLPSWSPDGSTIAFASKRGGDFDRHHNFDLYLISPQARRNSTTTDDVQGCRLQSGKPKPTCLEPRWRIDRLHSVGPRRADFLCRATTGRDSRGRRRSAVIDQPSRSKCQPAALERRQQGDLFSCWKMTGIAIWPRSRLATAAIERILTGRRNTTALDVSSTGKVVVLSGTPERPADILALDGEPRALARHNDKLLDEIELGAVEEIKFPSQDGTEIHGFVVKPPGFQPGQKYPTILSIHGGPVGQFPNDFMTSWQLFAAHGYLVVGANPRGSSGRGEAFSRAIFADWGHLDRDDVLAAVDYVVAQGLADPARLGVGGWSYGGILTNYVIASDRRFKAAVSGSSSSNMLATYGTDMYAREYEAELGPPWKNPELWLKLSYPFLHADRIVTPTLFLCGDKDFNVPLSNAEQMYQAVRSLGVDIAIGDLSRRAPLAEQAQLTSATAWNGISTGTESIWASRPGSEVVFISSQLGRFSYSKIWRESQVLLKSNDGVAMHSGHSVFTGGHSYDATLCFCVEPGGSCWSGGFGRGRKPAECARDRGR